VLDSINIVTVVNHVLLTGTSILSKERLLQVLRDGTSIFEADDCEDGTEDSEDEGHDRIRGPTGYTHVVFFRLNCRKMRT
jgi:hypothetical protein